MKNLIKIIVVLVLVSSCDGDCVQSHQELINLSGKSIEVTSFTYIQNTNSYIFNKNYTIYNNNKIEKSLKDCGAGAGRGSFSYLVEGDSIIIDYGDKVKSYSITTKIYEARNPYILDGNNKSNDFTYTITPEDYANAIQK
jgi:hypothetical protein